MKRKYLVTVIGILSLTLTACSGAGETAESGENSFASNYDFVAPDDYTIKNSSYDYVDDGLHGSTLEELLEEAPEIEDDPILSQEVNQTNLEETVIDRATREAESQFGLTDVTFHIENSSYMNEDTVLEIVTADNGTLSFMVIIDVNTLDSQVSYNGSVNGVEYGGLIDISNTSYDINELERILFEAGYYDVYRVIGDMNNGVQLETVGLDSSGARLLVDTANRVVSNL